MIEFKTFIHYLKKTKEKSNNLFLLKCYDKVEDILKTDISTIRVEHIESSFNKLHYIKINPNTRHKPSQNIYFGIIKSKKEIKTFKFRMDKSPTKEQFLNAAEKNSKNYNLNSFLNEMDKIEKNKKNKILQELSRFSEYNYAYDLSSKQNEEIKDILKKELYSLFKNKIEKRISLKKTIKQFNMYIFEDIDNSFAKDLSKKLTGSSLNFYHNIDNLLKKANKEDLIYTVNNYPLLVSLILENKAMPKREFLKVEAFHKNYKKDLNLIGNIKDFFELTDCEVENIKNKSWQKYTILKNRPIVIIDLIKMGLNLEDIKTRKEMKSIYFFYYYILSNNRFIFKNYDFNEIKKINVNKKLINKIKTKQRMFYKEFDYQRYFLSGENTYKFKIEKAEDFFHKMIIKESNIEILKNNIYIDNEEWILIPPLKDCYTYTYKNKEDKELKITITKITETDIKIKTESNSLTEIQHKNLERNIKIDLLNINDKRIKKLVLLNRYNIIRYIEENITEKENKQKNNVTIRRTNFKGKRKTETTDYLSSLFNEDKQREISLLDII